MAHAHTRTGRLDAGGVVIAALTAATMPETAIFPGAPGSTLR